MMRVWAQSLRAAQSLFVFGYLYIESVSTFFFPFQVEALLFCWALDNDGVCLNSNTIKVQKNVQFLNVEFCFLLQKNQNFYKSQTSHGKKLTWFFDFFFFWWFDQMFSTKKIIKYANQWSIRVTRTISPFHTFEPIYYNFLFFKSGNVS